MIKAVIFDCFGVLVGRGFDQTYRSAGGDPDADRSYIADVLGQANLGIISEDAFHTAMIAQLNIPMDTWKQVIAEAEQPDYALLTYIEKLHKTYRIAVLSNANVGVIEHKISRDWLDKCFDSIIVSAEVGMAKPNPEIYEHAAQQLGVLPTECVFLDDHEEYLVGARALGMQVILYQNFTQAKKELDALLVNDTE